MNVDSNRSDTSQVTGNIENSPKAIDQVKDSQSDKIMRENVGCRMTR